jgi:mono/diheme cytochrome c family protein
VKLLRILLKLATAVIVIVALAGIVVYLLSERRINRTYQVSVPPITVPVGAEAVARCKRLVTIVAPCADCHAADFGGKAMIDEWAMGTLHAANLTRGRGGIAARYSDEDWVRALLHGVRQDGRSVVFMPSHDFRFTEQNVADIIAFFRSLPPIDREHPAPKVGPMARALSFGPLPLLPAELIDHEKTAFTQPPTTDDPIARGQHLLDTAGCRGCHTPELAGGGGPPPGASNITPVGIGSWSDADFIAALRSHVRPNGTRISEAMPAAYGQMTDEELKAIRAYLRTVPAKGKPSKTQTAQAD